MKKVLHASYLMCTLLRKVRMTTKKKKKSCINLMQINQMIVLIQNSMHI